MRFTTRRWRRPLFLAAWAGLVLTTGRATSQAPPPMPNSVEPELLSSLSWRSIGPAMFAGRVADVAGVPGEPDVLYVGTASSGLYKSTNGGTTFESVFDDGNTLSIGAIAVQPDNPDVVYVGTGEGAVRNSISYGDGIYKTSDGGNTWQHLGLQRTERFSRIAIHPKDPKIILAAAMGHAFGPNQERGVYRSTDGGATWQRTLFVNESTGASDLAIDPDDPDIVYAGMYDYLRQPWHFRSGGPGSGLYRSEDGGITWTRLTDPGLDNGLPGEGALGRIGVSICAATPRVIYALIEAEAGGVLWRSDDRGITWQLVSSDRRLNNRPFYYTQVRADPVDPDRVYTLAGSFSASADGGRTFRGTGGSMFGDHHALWIDPLDNERLLCGTDGGFFLSNDRGRNWDFINNMPMAQAYHVGIDMAEPYNVLGGFQDHEIWRGPNEKWNQAGVREGDWVRLRYMADGMYAIPDPRDPNIVYYNGHFGDITRIDMRNGEERYIQPYPPGPHGGAASHELYRFNWNSPVHMSPSNPDVLYYGGNVLFKTTDQGETWSSISPDLTTNDPQKQRPSGGITLDNTRAEFHCTIFSIAESPLNPDVIWAGTDDGNLQITRDGGDTWTNVAPHIQGAPAFSWFSSISASHRSEGTAYVSVDQHRMDDFAPYVFASDDYGTTWRNISAGLTGYVHIVMEDPRQPDLLYAGTELGVFASFDRGRSWTDLRLGLPPLAVRDLKVHPRDNDLVIATHARGFYILDDVTPLQKLAPAVNEPVALFQPMPAVRYIPASDTSTLGNRVWVARNQPYGAILNYWLSESADRVNLEIRDSAGRTVRRLQGPGRAGVNRVVWNLAVDSSSESLVPTGRRDGGSATAGQGARGGRGVRGGRGARGGRGRRGGGGRDGSWIRAIPGEYQVRLTAQGQTREAPLLVRMDPNVSATQQDMEVWYQQARKIDQMDSTLRRASSRVRSLAEQLQALQQSVSDDAIRADITGVLEQLRPVVLGLNGDPNDPGHVNLSGRMNWLRIQVGNYSGRPTAAQIEWVERFWAMTQEYVAKLNELVAGDLARLNEKLRAAGLAEVSG